MEIGHFLIGSGLVLSVSLSVFRLIQLILS
jgi:hypothetical protein